MKNKVWKFVSDHVDDISYVVVCAGIIGLMMICYKLGTYDC